MQIILARYSGFCEGVNRAYKIALSATKRTKPVFILGDLVHNKDVAAQFTRLGVKKIKSLQGLKPGSTVIITAHGASPGLYERAKKLKLKIVDTTCPWVKKAQSLARELADAGRDVIIVGDKGHPEVAGLLKWAGRRSRVVEGVSDLGKIKLSDSVGVLAQTTQSEDDFARVVSALKGRRADVSVKNTICAATSKRQRSAKELSGLVDLMLVIGDLRSANSKRLKGICSKKVATRQIQNEKELKVSWLRGKNKIGITAGASTPDRVINKVIEKLNKYDKK